MFHAFFQDKFYNQAQKVRHGICVLGQQVRLVRWVPALCLFVVGSATSNLRPLHQLTHVIYSNPYKTAIANAAKVFIFYILGNIEIL